MENFDAEYLFVYVKYLREIAQRNGTIKSNRIFHRPWEYLTHCVPELLLGKRIYRIPLYIYKPMGLGSPWIKPIDLYTLGLRHIRQKGYRRKACYFLAILFFLKYQKIHYLAKDTSFRQPFTEYKQGTSWPLLRGLQGFPLTVTPTNPPFRRTSVTHFE